MIRIGILGDIGAGKSYVAKNFGYPVFNADYEVAKLYQKDKKIFNKLKKSLTNFIHSYPVNKKEIINAILINKKDLIKIVEIIHFEIRKKLKIFLKKNKSKKIYASQFVVIKKKNYYQYKDQTYKIPILTKTIHSEGLINNLALAIKVALDFGVPPFISLKTTPLNVIGPLASSSS